MTGVIKQQLSRLNNLLESRNVVFLAGVSAIIFVAIYVFIWSYRSDFDSLYQDLNKEDASQVAKALEERGIRYQLKRNGEEILVSGVDV